MKSILKGQVTKWATFEQQTEQHSVLLTKAFDGLNLEILKIHAEVAFEMDGEFNDWVLVDPTNPISSASENTR